MSGGHGKEKSGKRNELLDIFQRLRLGNREFYCEKACIGFNVSSLGMDYGRHAQEMDASLYYFQV